MIEQDVLAAVAEVLGDRAWPRRRRAQRTSAGWSEVATTTTERRSPSAPRLRSMNSSTSRPRSPISAITLTSARTLRAIMPSSVLLPTPLPEKMPTRWPLPIVSRRRCRARRSPARSRMRAPRQRVRAAPGADRTRCSGRRQRPAVERPRRTRRPRGRAALRRSARRAAGRWRSPRCRAMPRRSPKGISSTLPSSGRRPRPRSAGARARVDLADFAEKASGPADSTTRPKNWVMRPERRIRSALRIAEA